MCGIAGVYGNFALRKSVLLTLGQLERGTQGMGVAWLKDNQIRIKKEPIHPITFIHKHYNLLFEKCRYAISHNRMPSKGKVCYFNTHPFISCKYDFALIHNGTIFNDGLRKELLKKGHKIIGDTDSELLVHQLEEYLKKCGDMIGALLNLVKNELSGCIIVLTKDGKIYATRKGHNTLNYAKHNDEVYIASSSTAIKNLVGKDVDVIEVKSGQVIEVDDKGVKVHGESEELYDFDFVHYNAYYRYRYRFFKMMDDDEILYGIQLL